jgi:hypothetical protein
VRRICCGITFATVFFSMSDSYSQNYSAQNFYDLKTYQFYQNSQWDSVIIYADESLRNHIDFYYLRLRTGWAYVYKANYRMAEYHFNKALAFEFNSNDALKGLYTAQLYGNQIASARVSIPLLQNVESANIDFPGAYTVDDCYFEIGRKTSSDQQLKGDLFITSVSLQHTINHKLSIHQQYTYLKQGSPDGISTTQNQYYVSANYPITPDWYIQPAIHVVSVKNKIAQYTSFIKYAETGFRYKLISAGIFGAHVGNKYDYQWQTGGYFIYYPFGNVHLYINNSFTLHYDSEANPNLQKVWNPLIGFKATKFYWIELEYTGGKRSNYIDKSASIIYNTNDLLGNRFAWNNIVLINSDLSFFLLLTDETKNNIKRYHHTGLIGGLKWTFTKLPSLY